MTDDRPSHHLQVLIAEIEQAQIAMFEEPSPSAADRLNLAKSAHRDFLAGLNGLSD